MSTPQTDAEREIEKTINESRNIVTSPLMRLDKRIKKGTTGPELCEALYLLLEELDIPGKLEGLSAAAEEQGHLIASRKHDQAWKAVIDLLDHLLRFLGMKKYH